MSRTALLRRLSVVLGISAAAILAAVVPADSATTLKTVWPMTSATTSGTTMLDTATADGAQNGTLKNVAVSGSSYTFNGTSSVVSVPATSGEFNPGNQPVDLKVSVQFTVVPSKSVVDYDLIRGPTRGAYKIEIVARNNRTTGRASCFFQGVRNGKTVKADIVGKKNLADGNWHTIECRKDATSITQVVDGVSVVLKTTVGTMTNTSGLSLGAKDYRGGGDWYKGNMKDASVTIG